MIRIASKQAGFRRCGMPHPKEPVDYPDDKFSKDELKILKAEPMLIVDILPTEESGKGAFEEEDLVIAAKSAIALNKVTKDGKPLVEAMEELLGGGISSADRDRAWENLNR